MHQLAGVAACNAAEERAATKENRTMEKLQGECSEVVFRVWASWCSISGGPKL